MNITTEINREKLALVASEAIAKLKDSTRPDAKRWIRAIAKAVIEIENNPFITWQPETRSILILSQRSGEIYTANGTCGCKAYNQPTPMPCYHRAISQLIVRYLEL